MAAPLLSDHQSLPVASDATGLAVGGSPLRLSHYGSQPTAPTGACSGYLRAAVCRREPGLAAVQMLLFAI